MLQRYSAKWPIHSATAPSVQVQRYSARSVGHSATAPSPQTTALQRYSATALQRQTLRRRTTIVPRSYQL